MNKTIPQGLLLVAVGLAFAISAQTPQTQAPPVAVVTPVAEDPAHPRLPGFTRQTIDGKAFDSATLQGNRPLLIVYWAAWCGPCREEAPLLRKLKSDYGERLLMVGIAAGQGEEVEDARHAAKRWQLNYPIIFDQDESLRMIFNVQMVPQLILIGADHRLVIRTTDLPAMKKQLDLLIYPFTTDPT